MTLTRALELRKKYLKIKEEIPVDRILVCVTKNFPASDVEILYQLGHRDFGENRVQELQKKAISLKESCPEIRWHMIGHLQSNKIKMLLSIPHLVAIHSIDSIDLLNKLISFPVSQTIDIFLEVKTTSEMEKSGFEKIEELKKAILILSPQKKFKLRGLMTIGSIRADNFQEAARESFYKLIKLREGLDHSLKLSMGMSGDYPLALQMGSDLVRIGSKILGSRKG